VVQQAESGGEVTTTHSDSEAGYRFGPQEVDAVLRARRPERIALHAFLERWLPGLAGDGRRVCVLPDEHGQGATVAPATLKADIEEEREKIE